MDTIQEHLSSKAVELRLSLTGLGLDNETGYGIEEGYARIYSALKAVRDAERERCAKIAGTYARGDGRHIAAAIREGDE